MEEELTKKEQKELLYGRGWICKRIGDIEREICCKQETREFIVLDSIMTKNGARNYQVLDRLQDIWERWVDNKLNK